MVAPARPVSKLPSRRSRELVLLLLGISLTAPVSGETIDQSRSLVIRLLAPLASYSPPGTRFDARVIGPQLRENPSILPRDSIVSGKVDKSASVRFGVLRERAMLELAFDQCRLPDGRPVECKVALEEVDNAREQVSENRINGVLAASHPYSWIGGVWYRPTIFLLPRSAMGLTGAAGTLYCHVMPTPLGAAALMSSRLLLDRLPDPEIEFPAGTDLVVRVEVPDAFAPSAQPRVPISRELADWVATQPDEVRLPDNRLAGDVVNLVFIGSRQEVESAFSAAGWTTSDALTPRSFTRMYAAFSAMKADPTAPVAPLRYNGNTSALVFQKTLNTVSKRHHIRIWPASFSGTPVWLGAATHDTDITLDQRHMSLTHRIDPYVDRERSTVVNDMATAGCVSGVGTVERPAFVRAPGSGLPSVTDGKALVLFLDECSAPSPAGPNMPELQRRRFTLAARWFFLEDREYVLRDNIYYWAYRGIASLLRKRPESPSANE